MKPRPREHALDDDEERVLRKDPLMWHKSCCSFSVASSSVLPYLWQTWAHPLMRFGDSSLHGDCSLLAHLRKAFANRDACEEAACDHEYCNDVRASSKLRWRPLSSRFKDWNSTG